MSKGILITLEGPEGAGKTTILHQILPILTQMGVDILTTREPGGIRIAESIREIILAPENTAIDGKTELLLFAAARRQHLNEKVRPALAEGKIVIIDRFIDSSVAYQGYARGIDVADVETINNFATDGLLPDLTLYFDVDTEIGLSRVMSGDREVNRLDLEAQEMHQKVRAGYQAIAKANPKRIVTIDASQAIDQVVAATLSTLQIRFPEIFASVFPSTSLKPKSAAASVRPLSSAKVKLLSAPVGVSPSGVTLKVRVLGTASNAPLLSCTEKLKLAYGLPCSSPSDTNRKCPSVMSATSTTVPAVTAMPFSNS